jgi:hypothetical protein
VRVLAFGLGLIVMALGTLLVLVTMSGTAVDAWGRAYLVDSPHKLPKADAVLVLGTSPHRLARTSWRDAVASRRCGGGPVACGARRSLPGERQQLRRRL